MLAAALASDTECLPVGLGVNPNLNRDLRLFADELVIEVDHQRLQPRRMHRQPRV